MEKLELNLTRFEDLQGRNGKALQYLKAVKLKKQLEDYIKELQPDMIEMVKEMTDQKAITPMGTIAYIKETTRETLDKNLLEEKVGKEIIKECTKVSQVAASLRTSLRVEN